jgi:hypothetical protein
MLETAGKPKVQKRSADDVVDMSIVLVCWNNKAYLDPCLKSLYEGGLKSSFDVIVVDNGSTDGSQQMLAEKYPDVTDVYFVCFNDAVYSAYQEALNARN